MRRRSAQGSRCCRSAELLYRLARSTNRSHRASQRYLIPKHRGSSLVTGFHDDPEGLALWEKIAELRDPIAISTTGNGMSEDPLARYGEPTLIRPRLGQGAFRLLVTDLYGRRCAITRERTLPALEAAHSGKPYGNGGEHVGANGILFRRDIHSLFDAGYVTITKDYRFEVSKRIKEEFENGREYYALNGKSVAVLRAHDFTSRRDRAGLA